MGPVRAGKLGGLAFGLWALACVGATAPGRESVIPSPQPQGTATAELRLAVFPPFFQEPRSGWVETGDASPLSDARARFAEGLQRGNFLPAIRAFGDALASSEKPPWAGEALWHMAEGYHRMGHFDEALAYWRVTLTALAVGRQAARAKAALAEALFRVGRSEDALPAFESVVKELHDADGRSWALLRLGDCWTEQGDATKAGSHYLAAEKLRPPARWFPPESLENLARSGLAGKRHAAAQWAIMTALSLHAEHPRRARWLCMLGEVYVGQGRLAEATIVLERVPREHPFAKETHLANLRLMALERRCHGKHSQMALAPSPRGLLDPRHPAFHEDPEDVALQNEIVNLGKCLLARGEHRLALPILLNARRGFHEGPSTPALRRAIVDAMRDVVTEANGQGSHQQAVQMIDGLGDTVPEMWQDPILLARIGASYEAMGFWETAARLYGKVRSGRAAGAAHGEATMGLMRATLALGRTKETLALINEASADAAWKGDAQRLLQWVVSARETEVGPLASAWLAEIQSGRISPTTLVAVGRWSLAHGIQREGAEFLERSLAGEASRAEDADPSWAEAWAVQGDLLDHVGRKRDAISCFDRALKRNPWGELEKWSAHRAAQIAVDAGAGERAMPYLEPLLKEPPGSLWRTLAEQLKARLRPGAGTEGGRARS
jgi:tetratricopeptide (TPR) repeat protein